MRGSERDVLGRFVQAWERYPAEAVVRICADNPLTDPEQIDSLVAFFLETGLQETGCDYAYNNYCECGLPGGLGGEILSGSVLRFMDRHAARPEHREHVTSFLKDNRQNFRICMPPAPFAGDYPRVDLDVDYPEDRQFLEALCGVLRTDRRPYWSTQEIVEALRMRPEFIELRYARRSVS